MRFEDFGQFMREIFYFFEYPFPVFGFNVSLFQVTAYSMTFAVFMRFVRKMFGGREDV